MSSSAEDNNNKTSGPPVPVVYSMPGSQFVFKVLAAIESRKNVEYYVESVSMNAGERTKKINRKDGKSSVPVLKFVSSSDGKVEEVCDSELILHWFDDNYKTNFFPPDTDASDLSVRASDKTLSAMVWYYNWVDYAGYSNSMKVGLTRFIPLGWMLPNFVIDLLLSSTRNKFREMARKQLGNLDDAVLDDEKQMRAKLLEELEYFQSLLKDENQPYLIPGSSEPTAADFSVYAQVERLVGGGKSVSDSPVRPARLEFKTEVWKESLARLWKWHDLMREKFPCHFRGKSPPKEVLDQIEK